jgi:cytochrome c oxidase subunit 2
MELTQVPKNAYEIQVTAQRWLWTFDYPNGATTTNELHVPTDQPVKLVMKSKSGDVIHSFYVPDYRVKKDVLPNQYTKVWFNITEPGESDLFCAEYCGTEHSSMTGTVIAHPKEEFEEWLAQAGAESTEDLSPVERGEKLFTQNGCQTCHSLDGSQKVGPTFDHLAGTERSLKNGRTVVADEDYLEHAIRNPADEVVEGYPANMPSYEGTLSDADIQSLILFIKGLNGSE